MIHLILSFLLFAETTQTLSVATKSFELPTCIDSPEKIHQITSSIKTNSKNQHKYAAYQKEFSLESDAHILARLAYAETLAANCPQLQSEVASRVMSVIGQRVLKRKGNVKSVVFQRDQFSSSLNIYESSRYKDFLCPKDKNLWSLVYQKAEKALQTKQSSVGKDSVNYFFYQHDPRWTKEPWKLEEDTTNTSPALQKCLRVFKVSNWK